MFEAKGGPEPKFKHHFGLCGNKLFTYSGEGPASLYIHDFLQGEEVTTTKLDCPKECQPWNTFVVAWHGRIYFGGLLQGRNARDACHVWMLNEHQGWAEFGPTCDKS